MSNVMSTYQQGFAGGLNIRGANVAVNHPGKIFWVADGDTAGNTAAYPNRRGASDFSRSGGTFLAPFKTLDYAIGQCVAGRGDVIYVLPGYVDTLVAADEINLDVAGITIIGLGTGNKQPLIQFDNAVATFALDAANLTVRGLNFAASVTVVAKGVDVKDGADDYELAGNRWTSDEAGMEFEDSLFVTTADRGLIEENSFIMRSGADADSAIHLVGAILGATVRKNYVEGDYSVACIEHVTSTAEMVVLDGNTLTNGVHGGLNTVACISLATGTTGLIQDNTLYANVAAGSAIVSDATFRLNNYHSSTADSAPVLLDAATTGWQTVDSTSNPLGVDDADNAFSSTSVVANENGSILERLEQVQKAVHVGAGAVLGSNTSLIDVILGSNSAGKSAQFGTVTNTSAKDALDGGTTNLFSINSGRVLITSLTAEVSGAAVDATPSATKFVANPTVGTTVDLCATVDVNGHELGTMYAITGIFADALGAGESGAVSAMQAPVVVNAGSIDIVSAADAGTGGAVIITTVTWIPLDAGASINAT